MAPQTIVYVICMVTSVILTLLLTRSYLRTRTKLLLFCAISFALLAANNTLFVIDLVWMHGYDLLTVRQFAAFSAVVVLIYGFIWETR